MVSGSVSGFDSKLLASSQRFARRHPRNSFLRHHPPVPPPRRSSVRAPLSRSRCSPRRRRRVRLCLAPQPRTKRINPFAVPSLRQFQNAGQISIRRVNQQCTCPAIKFRLIPPPRDTNLQSAVWFDRRALQIQSHPCALRRRWRLLESFDARAQMYPQIASFVRFRFRPRRQ